MSVPVELKKKKIQPNGFGHMVAFLMFSLKMFHLMEALVALLRVAIHNSCNEAYIHSLWPQLCIHSQAGLGDASFYHLRKMH